MNAQSVGVLSKANSEVTHSEAFVTVHVLHFFTRPDPLIVFEPFFRASYGLHLFFANFLVFFVIRVFKENFLEITDSA